MPDVIFVIPDSSKESYQGLADNYSAIEPPTWALLLAGGLRKKGFSVEIIDPLAEKLTDHEVYSRIIRKYPKLICFVVYGQNPNSGTTNMAGAYRLLYDYRLGDIHTPIAFIGSHPSALPDEVKSIYGVDYVCPGDGFNALQKILYGCNKGVVWGEPCKPEELDYAWDLIDLSKYRCHTWHNNFGLDRSPFAAIYTSLGCVFKCDFCMINLVNRSSPDQLDASQSSGMRYFDPLYILRQFEILQSLGVRNVRISDEMFFLNKNHYLPILRGLIGRGIKLNLWAYARVDTVRPEYLSLFKQAGINWLCLGIESANQTVRREIAKGSYESVDVRQVAREIRESGINLLANFIVGLPDDAEESMQETLDLAIELQAEHTNIYPCMALPGSPIHREAVRNGTSLPSDYSGYGFLSYECTPLPTKTVSAKRVLEFRDNAWERITLNPKYLAMIERKFGKDRAKAIYEQALIPMKRKLLES